MKPRKPKPEPRKIGTLVKLTVKYVVLDEPNIREAMDRVFAALNTAAPALAKAKAKRLDWDAQLTLVDENNCKRLTGYSAPPTPEVPSYCQCPIENHNDLPDGPTCLVCGKRVR